MKTVGHAPYCDDVRRFHGVIRAGARPVLALIPLGAQNQYFGRWRQLPVTGRAVTNKRFEM